MSKRKSCLHYLRNREMGFFASMPRNDYELFKCLFLSENRIFKRTEEFTSSSGIFFEADRLYLNHYRQAYSVIKRNVIYDLDQTISQDNSNGKIIDADIFYLTSASEPSDIICSELFIGLTDLHRIMVLDSNNGKCLRTFQLPPKDHGYKFTEIGLGKDNETFYVKGRYMDLRLPSSKRPHFVFSMFNLIPFRFDCTFVLREEVFGPFVNVTINQDMIIFVHAGCVMKFYSLEHLLREGTRKGSDSFQNGILYPNLVIDAAPPCLYSIRVTSETLEMGGFPWHCLYKRPKQLQYSLESLANGSHVKLEKDQLLQIDPALGMEVNVFFHPDESGSIVCVSENQIEKLVIGECESNGSTEWRKLKQSWSLPIRQIISAEEDIMYTASGRKAFRSSWTCQDDLQYVHCVQYLSSIDSLCVVVYYETPVNEDILKRGRTREKSMVGGKAKILIVDNVHGRITKEILLEEQWDNTCQEHHIELDDDVLVHTIKHRSGKYSCHVYRLTEIMDDTTTPVKKLRKRPSQLPANSRKSRRRVGEDSSNHHLLKRAR